MSPAHAPQLRFEHRPHPHSLPCLTSCKLTLSRALLSPLALAGVPRPPCWLSSPSEAAPSHPELCPEVRNPFPCLFSLFAPHLSQFSLVEVYPRRFANSAPSRAPVLAHGTPLPLSELVRALSRLPATGILCRSYPDPPGAFPSTVLPSMVPVSWLEPHQCIRHVLLADPGQHQCRSRKPPRR
jgi:hypothetical protein